MKMIELRRVGLHGMFKAAALTSDFVGDSARRREHELSLDALDSDMHGMDNVAFPWIGYQIRWSIAFERHDTNGILFGINFSITLICLRSLNTLYRIKIRLVQIPCYSFLPTVTTEYQNTIFDSCLVFVFVCSAYWLLTSIFNIMIRMICLFVVE